MTQIVIQIEGRADGMVAIIVEQMNVLGQTEMEFELARTMTRNIQAQTSALIGDAPTFASIGGPKGSVGNTVAHELEKFRRGQSPPPL